MANQEIELFVHAEGAKPRVISAQPSDVLSDVLISAETIRDGQMDVLVFVGECSEALAEPDEVENGADEQVPVDINLTVEKLEINRHRHVHCHRCSHVAVDVNFGATTKRRRFSPATTIGVVTQWARKKFRLDPASASEYVLQICNSTDQPRATMHLGELVQAPKCAICFDLVKEITPQG